MGMLRAGCLRALCACASVSLVTTLHASDDARGARFEVETNPISITPLRWTTLDEFAQPREPWTVYEHSEDVSGFCDPQRLMFDAFQPDSSGAPTGGIACGLPTENARYRLAEDFCNPYIANDFTTPTAWGGLGVSRIEFAFEWYVTGEGSEEQCFVALWLADTFGADCRGVSNDDIIGEKLLFDFGVLASTAGPGYYYFDINPSLVLPDDARGAYALQLGNRIDLIFGIQPATCAQPMLWGVPEPGALGRTDPEQWDDLNADFFQSFEECNDYAAGLCHDPLGAMFCMYSNADAQLELFVPSVVTSGQNTMFEVFGEPHGTAALFFAFSQGAYFHDFPALGWCLQLGLQLPMDPRTNVLCVIELDADGAGACLVGIPERMRGATLNFQAALKGTCPCSASSAIETRTVE